MAPFSHHHVLVGRLSGLSSPTDPLQPAMDVCVLRIRYGALVDVSRRPVVSHVAERLDAHERHMALELAGMGAGHATLPSRSS